MRDTFLAFSPPNVAEEEIAEVVDTLRSSWITTGPKTQKFAAEFAKYVNAPAAVPLNSCTAGLHAILVALGIGPGDEVITTTNTFAATVNVVEHVGATPILVDVEPDTLNIDPVSVERAISPRTKAIIPVHFAGHPVDLDPIYELAETHSLTVVEDAAHSLPAKYKGRMIGSSRNPVAFSFYATKNLTTAEGGMVTGDPVLLDKIRIIGLHGMSRDAWRRYDKGGSWFYEVVLPGFKYNMTDIQASIGLWQLRRLADFQKRRREIVVRYNEAFSSDVALQVPVERENVESAWHLYVLRLNEQALTINRDRFIEELAGLNIGTSVHFIPVHTHPYYRDKYGYRPDDLPVAYDSFRRMLSLPLHPGLSDDDVEYVIEAVLYLARKYRR